MKKCYSEEVRNGQCSYISTNFSTCIKKTSTHFGSKQLPKNKFGNVERNLKYRRRWKQVFWELKRTSNLNIQWSLLWLVCMWIHFKWPLKHCNGSYRSLIVENFERFYAWFWFIEDEAMEEYDQSSVINCCQHFMIKNTDPPYLPHYW